MENPRLNQNLISQVPAEVIMQPPGFYKAILFDALTVGAALGLSYFYREYLTQGMSLIIPLLWAAAFGVLTVFQVLVRRSLGRRALVLVLETAALFAFFSYLPPQLLVLSLVTTFLFLVWGESGSRNELENNLQIKFFRAAKPQLAKLTTVLSLIAVVLLLPSLQGNNVFISEPSFRSFFDSTAGLVSNFYPELTFTSSFGSLAESLARYELNSSPLFRTLPTANQEQALRDATQQVLANMSKTLGVPVSADESTSRVLYKLIVHTLGEWQLRYGNAFLVAWTLALFLVLRSLGAIAYWLVCAVAFVLYQFFLAVNVLHVEGESRTHEIVEFS